MPVDCDESAVRICPVVPTPCRVIVLEAVATTRSPLVVKTDFATAPPPTRFACRPDEARWSLMLPLVI